MKRFIILVTGLLACCISYADAVSESRAEMFANFFFGNSSLKAKLAAGPSEKSVETPPYYIFNNPDGGWVVISGEDSTYPVLAYSTDSFLDESMMQGAIKYWFDGLAQDIINAREAGLEADEDIEASWSKIQNVRLATQKCLDTAPWGQHSPFNDLCPKITGEAGRAVSGCVATAMAIVLRYHGYPEKGKGTIGGYATSSKKHRIDEFSIDSHEYHLSEIPSNSNTSRWTDDQRSWVAQLVYDCGVMVEMDYSYDGSGAFSMDVLPALKEHMGYSKKGTYLLRSMFTMSEWIEKLEKEIDAGRPVLYGGQDSEEGGGHQFVVDGYDSDGKMHINWGWNGSANGYFALNYLGNRTNVGYVFDASQDAMIGVEPDPDGTSEVDVPVLYLEASKSGNGIELKSGTIAKGSNFTLSFSSIWNYFTSGAYNGSVRAGVIDYNDNLKEYIGTPASLSLNFGYGSAITSYKATLTGDIAPGDRIVLFYTDKSGSWIRMYGDREGSTVDAYPLVDDCFIRCESSYESGEEYCFELINGKNAISSITWYYDGVQTSEYKVKLTSGEHSIKALVKFSSGGTETIVQKIVVN